jgi:hypothetical protein
MGFGADAIAVVDDGMTFATGGWQERLVSDGLVGVIVMDHFVHCVRRATDFLEDFRFPGHEFIPKVNNETWGAPTTTPIGQGQQEKQRGKHGRRPGTSFV